jgi:hypothetical protein
MHIKPLAAKTVGDPVGADPKTETKTEAAFEELFS